MDCNRLVVCGEIRELDTLRYTPAGLALVNFTIGHVSEQVEAGMKRRVDCDIAAMALTETAQMVASLKVGANVRAEGFLSRKSRNNQLLVLHVNRIELI